MVSQLTLTQSKTMRRVLNAPSFPKVSRSVYNVSPKDATYTSKPKEGINQTQVRSLRGAGIRSPYTKAR